MALAGSLLLARGDDRVPSRVRRILPWAAAAAGLWIIEGAFHLFATVDRTELIAGRGTPVLSAHLALALVVYPAVGVSAATLATAFAWHAGVAMKVVAALGVLGALSYGAAGPVVILSENQDHSHLFLGAITLSLWLVVQGAVALWSERRPVAVA